jgi:hypothetical protein
LSASPPPFELRFDELRARSWLAIKEERDTLR